MPRLYNPNYIVKVLLQNDFIFISQKGSHAKYKKEGFIVIVPIKNKEIPIGTFRSILRQSSLSIQDFK